MILYELTRGFAYQRIKHPEAHWYARTLPLALTVVGSSFLLLLPGQPIFLGKDGLIASSLTVISTLPGFYFAGLAAVATFSGINMDAVMPSPAPTLSVKVGGTSHDIELSRRQFLSYLFSYLVVVSAILCISVLIVYAVTPSIVIGKVAIVSNPHGELIWCVMRSIGVLAYIGLCSCLLITTLHGIFFLTEKIHQP